LRFTGWRKKKDRKKKAGKRKTTLRNQGWGTRKKKSDPEFTGANGRHRECARANAKE
jgi:hypothetical protein